MPDPDRTARGIYLPESAKLMPGPVPSLLEGSWSQYLAITILQMEIR